MCEIIPSIYLEALLKCCLRGESIKYYLYVGVNAGKYCTHLYPFNTHVSYEYVCTLMSTELPQQTLTKEFHEIKLYPVISTNMMYMFNNIGIIRVGQ